jgi:hypothetical protein
MDLSFHNETTLFARFRRELRNPSMFTIFLIVRSFSIVVLAPFAPKWVATTKDSFDVMSEKKKINQESMSSLAAMVPSQITPWMAQQARTMSEASGPLDWKVVSFRTGPCNLENLSQLPDGKYSDSIAEVCGELDRIQRIVFSRRSAMFPMLRKKKLIWLWELFGTHFQMLGLYCITLNLNRYNRNLTRESK